MSTNAEMLTGDLTENSVVERMRASVFVQSANGLLHVFATPVIVTVTLPGVVVLVVTTPLPQETPKHAQAGGKKKGHGRTNTLEKLPSYLRHRQTKIGQALASFKHDTPPGVIPPPGSVSVNENPSAETR
jgi:hypothetical protein